MRDYSIFVQKYGGSSVATPEKIRKVAGFIKSQAAANKKFLIVVSAMGKTTDNLLALAKNITDNPSKRELDMLVSCGERISMTLLAIALNHMGFKALSLTGSQSGIITDDNHREAEIIEVRPNRVLEAFDDFDVVIVAGFQGVSQKKEITTLKRGGSDTTAVAMAKALSADSLEIYSDVPGVMTADPNLVKRAELLPQVSFDEACGMTLYGAKVLAYDAANLALREKVSLICAKTGENNPNTKITHTPLSNNRKTVLAITHLLGMIKIKVTLKLLEEISEPILLTNKQDFLTGIIQNDHLPKDINKSDILDYKLCLIVIHMADIKNINNILQKVITLQNKHNFNFNDIVLANKQIFMSIHENELKEAINILHDNLLSLES